MWLQVSLLTLVALQPPTCSTSAQPARDIPQVLEERRDKLLYEHSECCEAAILQSCNLCSLLSTECSRFISTAF